MVLNSLNMQANEMLLINENHQSGNNLEDPGQRPSSKRAHQH